MQAITIQGHWGESLLNQAHLQHFLGKRVIVTVIALDETPPPPKREWSLLGSVNLGGKLDLVNIRDFAHE
ncbi:MAG: hypothetical protein R3D00_23555 [Bacteroidia bacterium]